MRAACRGQQGHAQQPRLPSARPRPGTGCWCCSSGAAPTAPGCERSGAEGARRPATSAPVRRGLLHQTAAVVSPLHLQQGWWKGSGAAPAQCPSSHRATTHAAGRAAAGISEPRGAAGAGEAVGALPLCPGALPAGSAPSPPPLPALLRAGGGHNPAAHWAGEPGAAQPQGKPARGGSCAAPGHPTPGGRD